MSNEELVAVIQAGAAECMGELWKQVAGLVAWKARHVLTALDGRGGVEFDDLYQSGYLAMVSAVDTYKPGCGVFSTWFMYHLKTAFATATGYRTRRERNEPLNNALSLDTPLTDDSDSDTMLEIIADPDGQKPTQSVEEAVFHQQLHDALETALDAIPEQYSEILRQRHYQGLTLAEIGELRGVATERVRQMEGKAIRQIRRPSIACHLRPFYDFDFYCGTGLGTFQHTGMSIQERYLVLEEERKEKAERQRLDRERRRREKKNRIAFEESMEHARQ